MKILLSFLCSLFLIVQASAQSPYAGKYYSISMAPDGNAVAGTNFKVKKNGRIKGHGAYINFSRITVKGQVQNDGSFTISENSAANLPPITGQLVSNGTTFRVQLSTGNVVVGARVPDDFRVAGVYYARTNDGYDGLFIVTSSRQLLGGFYIPSTGGGVSVRGLASLDGFGGSTESGIYFQGTFSGEAVSGTFSNGAGYSGTFSGTRL